MELEADEQAQLPDDLRDYIPESRRDDASLWDCIEAVRTHLESREDRQSAAAAVKALQLIAAHREAVDRAESDLIQQVIARGWTWEELGTALGKRSRQSMQQHAKRVGARVRQSGSRARPSERNPTEPRSIHMDSAPPQPLLIPTVGEQAADASGVEQAVPRVNSRDDAATRWQHEGPTVPNATGYLWRMDRRAEVLRRAARFCPSCGHTPATMSDLGRLREDLKVSWLHPDPRLPGEVSEVLHCEHCQPSPGETAAVSCLRCDDSGPLLAYTLAAELRATGAVPAAVIAWLADHGWRSLPGGALICPDHPAGAA
ncbi:Uncharacterised protein [Nocardia otitidiscaviarum]|uniref:Uncharacterized protein n=1 Tax=Nocardia otitidiscaviarum TaxID=1823 RepID=A0A379JLR2_9NOCA|nr:hypothetical protein [Nocardia otitidiscaviarum]SUD49542.1 Uncharacterised protein [Nocardia otitidiscaviarum]